MSATWKSTSPPRTPARPRCPARRGATGWNQTDPRTLLGRTPPDGAWTIPPAPRLDSTISGDRQGCPNMILALQANQPATLQWLTRETPRGAHARTSAFSAPLPSSLPPALGTAARPGARRRSGCSCPSGTSRISLSPCSSLRRCAPSPSARRCVGQRFWNLGADPFGRPNASPAGKVERGGGSCPASLYWLDSTLTPSSPP